MSATMNNNKQQQVQFAIIKEEEPHQFLQQQQKLQLSERSSTNSNSNNFNNNNIMNNKNNGREEVGEEDVITSTGGQAIVKSNNNNSNSSQRESTMSIQLQIIKEGYLCQKTEHYRLKVGNTGIGKSWKVYKAVLKGTKLYFFKPVVGSDAEFRLLFPQGSSMASQTDKSLGSNVSSIAASTEMLSTLSATSNVKRMLGLGIGGSSTLTTQQSEQQQPLLTSPTETGSEKGLVLVPSMFDASTRLLLFSETIVAPQILKRESRVVGSRSSGGSSGRDSGSGGNKSSMSLVSKYEFGDAFIEVEFPAMKFRQQLVLLIFDDNVMLLTKKWVRITKSVDAMSAAAAMASSGSPSESAESLTQQQQRVKLSDLKLAGSHIDMLSSGNDLNNSSGSAAASAAQLIMSGASSKTMTKLTLDATFPLIRMRLKSFDHMMTSSMSGSGANDMIYGLEMTMPDESKRYFKARHQAARDRFMEKFERSCKRLKEELTSRGVSVTLGSATAATVQPPQSQQQPQQKQRGMRKFWGVGRHPELVSATGGVDELVGGSWEALIHDFLFRNVGRNAANTREGVAVVDYPLLMRFLVNSAFESESVLQLLMEESIRLLQLAIEKTETGQPPQQLPIVAIVSRLLEMLAHMLKSESFTQFMFSGSEGADAPFTPQKTPQITTTDWLIERIDTIMQIVECKDFTQFSPQQPAAEVTSRLDECKVAVDQVVERMDKRSSSGPAGAKNEPKESMDSVQLLTDVATSHAANLQKIPAKEFACQLTIHNRQQILRLLDLPDHQNVCGLDKALPECLLKSLTAGSPDTSLFYLLLPSTASPYANPLTVFILHQLLSTTAAKSMSASKRAQLLSYWIVVAQICLREFGNEYAATCIRLALQQPEVLRLVESWQNVSQDLKDWLSSSNSATTRAPSIIALPHVGDYLWRRMNEVLHSAEEPLVVDVIRKGWLLYRSIISSVVEGPLENFYSQPADLRRKHAAFHDFLSNNLKQSPVVPDILSALYSSLLPATLAQRAQEHPEQLQQFSVNAQSQFYADSMACEQSFYFQPASGGPSQQQVVYNQTNLLLTFYQSQHQPHFLQFFSAISSASSSSSGCLSLLKQLIGATQGLIQPAEELKDPNGELIISVVAGKQPSTILYLKAATFTRILDLLVLGYAKLNDFNAPSAATKLFPAPVILQSADQFDQMFIESFFACYRSFIRPLTLLDELKQRYISFASASSRATGSATTPSGGRERIVRVLRLWMENYFEDFMDDPHLMEKMQKCILLMMSKEEQQSQQQHQQLEYLQRVLDSQRANIPATVSQMTAVASTQSPMAVGDAEGGASLLEQFGPQEFVAAMQRLTHDLYASVTPKDWLQFMNLMLNSSQSLCIDASSMNRYFSGLKSASAAGGGGGAAAEDLFEVQTIFQALQFLSLPTAMTTGTTLIPLRQLLPRPVQTLLNVHENLRAVCMHFVISASNARHRISRIKFLLDSGKQLRRHLGPGSPPVRAIASALTSPQSRQFTRVWSALSEMPVDGLLLSSPTGSKSGSKDNLNQQQQPAKDAFDAAETYLDLLDALYFEFDPELLPQRLLQSTGTLQQKFPSIQDLLEYFLYMTIEQPNSILMGGSSSSSSSPSKGISANTGLPLINYEKRFMSFMLIHKVLLQNKQSAIGTTVSDLPSNVAATEFGAALRQPNQFSQLPTDLQNAVIAARSDIQEQQQQSGTSPKKLQQLFAKIKLFQKLAEAEKELKKRRDKDLRHLMEVLQEKDHQQQQHQQQHIKSGSTSNLSATTASRDTGQLGTGGGGSRPSLAKTSSNRSIAGQGAASQQQQPQQPTTPSSPMLSSLFRINTFKRDAVAAAGSATPNSANRHPPVKSTDVFLSTPALNVSGSAVSSNSSSNSQISSGPSKERPKTASDRQQVQQHAQLQQRNPIPSTSTSTQQVSKNSTAASATGTPTNRTSFQFPAGKPVKTISLLHSRSHVASDYMKRAFVFRILTEDEQEIMLQALSKEDMQDWIRKLNEVSIEGIRKLEDTSVSKNSAAAVSASSGSAAASSDLQQLKQQQQQQQQQQSKKQKGGADVKKAVYQSNSGGGEENAIVSTIGRTFKVDLTQLLLREVEERKQYKQHVETQMALHQQQLQQQQQSATSSNSVLNFIKKTLQSTTTPIKLPQLPTTYLSTPPVSDLTTFVWNDSNSLPVIAEKCILEVEARGLQETGIYRLSGTNTAIKELKRLFDIDPYSVDLSPSEYPDINNITGLFKLWLRELPEPLLTYRLFDYFMQAAEIEEYDDRLISIKELCHELPRPNFYILKRLLEHLDRVTDYEEKNNMYATNLAIVFGPTLFRPPPPWWYHSMGMQCPEEKMSEPLDLESQNNSDAFASSALTSTEALNNPLHGNATGSSGQGQMINDTDANIATTMRHLGKCNTIVKNMILQYHWLFDVDREGDLASNANYASNAAEFVMEDSTADTPLNDTFTNVKEQQLKDESDVLPGAPTEQSLDYLVVDPPSIPLEQEEIALAANDQSSTAGMISAALTQTSLPPPRNYLELNDEFMEEVLDDLPDEVEEKTLTFTLGAYFGQGGEHELIMTEEESMTQPQTVQAPSLNINNSTATDPMISVTSNMATGVAASNNNVVAGSGEMGSGSTDGDDRRPVVDLNFDSLRQTI